MHRWFVSQDFCGKFTSLSLVVVEMDSFECVNLTSDKLPGQKYTHCKCVQTESMCNRYLLCIFPLSGQLDTTQGFTFIDIGQDDIHCGPKVSISS